MSDREKPQPRVQPATDADPVVRVECPFTHDDGWNEVTIGWSEEDNAWLANVSTQMGAIGISETSQLHAMVDLVGSLLAMCHIYERREVELHRAIYSSSDVLVKELREAERDLHKVQQLVCNLTDGKTSTTETLQPLWRAERAIEAFAARIATPPLPDEAAA